MLQSSTGTSVVVAVSGELVIELSAAFVVVGDDESACCAAVQAAAKDRSKTRFDLRAVAIPNAFVLKMMRGVSTDVGSYKCSPDEIVRG